MRNYLNGNWIVSSASISCTYHAGRLTLSNTGDESGFARLVVTRRPRNGWHTAQLEGSILERTAGPLYFVNEANHILGEASLGSTALFLVDGAAELALYIQIPPHCSFEYSILVINKLSRFAMKPVESYCDQALTSRTAIVVPTYPTLENKYLCAFVHARVKAYRDAGLAVDVICARDADGYGIYDYEDVCVLRVPKDALGRLLARKAYDSVALHFFDETFARAIDGQGLGKTRLVLWSHNPETRYWEWPLFTTPYFTELPALTDEQKELFRQRDAIVKAFNEKTNVSWVFISEAQQKRAEELVGVTFNRAHVIPNIVDEERFPYAPKDPHLRTKVFCVRKFDDIATYAIDIDVATVIELSKRDVFDRLTFDFFGDGPMFDSLLEPISHFENVRLHKRFLSHDEIALEHARHGIGLFATRFDSQGVSMCEAAMSGMAVVSSDIDAANFFLPNDLGLLCEVENPVAYADVIERLATDEDYFQTCSASCHDKIYRLCRREMTIDKEIALLTDSLG